MNAPKNLATNLKQLRHDRGYSQMQLAEIAGLPRSTVSHLESGSANPALDTLLSVAGALSVRIEELISQPRGLISKADAQNIKIETRRGGVKIHKLLPSDVTNHEMDRVVLPAGTRMLGVPHTAGTKEFLYCVKGEIRVSVAGESLVANAGDVLSFPGNHPHSYYNPNRSKAEYISVVILHPH